MPSEGNTPKNGEPTVCFSFTKNAPAHQSVLVKNFFANKHLRQTPEHPPYSLNKNQHHRGSTFVML